MSTNGDVGRSVSSSLKMANMNLLISWNTCLELLVKYSLTKQKNDTSVLSFATFQKTDLRIHVSLMRTQKEAGLTQYVLTNSICLESIGKNLLKA